MSNVERGVLEHLDEARMVEDLVTLVRVPSVSGSPAECEVQDVAAGLLDEAGLAVDRWDINLEELYADEWFPGCEVTRDAAIGVVGTLGGAEDQPALALGAHLDVVPPGDPEAWHGTDPFSAEVQSDLVYGRGACDMKAGGAAIVAAVRAIRDSGIRLERPLAVHFVTGEEDGGLGAFATLRRGHRADAAVITEPTDSRMIVATAGALTFRIEVFGRSAHGSLRNEGVSAFEAFLPIHQALLALEQDRNIEVDPLFGTRTLPYALSFGMVQAGDWSSNVPDKLVAEGRYGVMLGEDPRTARTAFEDAVTEASLKDPWLRENRPVVTWPGGQFASGSIAAEHPLVGEVQDAIRAVSLPEPFVGAEVYGSDLRLYTGIGGIPTLHYGPGDPLQAHSPLEHVSIEETLGVARALVVLALRRCGVAS